MQVEIGVDQIRTSLATIQFMMFCLPGSKNLKIPSFLLSFYTDVISHTKGRTWIEGV
jgi:hypothetical protein